MTVGSDKEEDGKWPYAGTAEAINNCGSKHSVKDVTVSLVTTYIDSDMYQSKFLSFILSKFYLLVSNLYLLRHRIACI